jgi:hypothetical protein
VVLITAGALENLRKTCSPGNPAPRRNPWLKRTRTDAIVKKFYLYENDYELINLNRKTLIIY